MSNRLVSSMITKEEFAGIVAAPIPLAAPTAAEVEEAIVIKNLTFLQKFSTPSYHCYSSEPDTHGVI